MDSLYKEEILEHFREPRNFGKLKDFDASSKQTNPFCGDEIEMFIRVRPQGLEAKVEKISFVGKGCAICIASCSILTEFAKGKTKKQLTKFSEKDMLNLLNIELSEIRKKCGLLGFWVLKDCLKFVYEI